MLNFQCKLPTIALFLILEICNKTVQKGYNSWCDFVWTTDPVCVKFRHYYISVLKLFWGLTRQKIFIY